MRIFFIYHICLSFKLHFTGRFLIVYKSWRVQWFLEDYNDSLKSTMISLSLGFHYICYFLIFILFLIRFLLFIYYVFAFKFLKLHLSSNCFILFFKWRGFYYLIRLIFSVMLHFLLSKFLYSYFSVFRILQLATIHIVENYFYPSSSTIKKRESLSVCLVNRKA